MFDHISIVSPESLNISKLKYSAGKAGKNAENVSFEVVSQEPPVPVFLILEFPETNNVFNEVIFEFSKGNKKSIKVNFFYSLTGNLWKSIPIRIIDESDDRLLFKLPLIKSNFLQIVLTSEIGAGIGEVKISNLVINKKIDILLKASSFLDRLWVVENLIDKREDYGWSSATYSESKDVKESLDIDLSDLYYINEIRMRAVKSNPNYFPSSFSILGSKDKANWDFLTSEKDFYVSSSNWYSWNIMANKYRFLRIAIDSLSKIKKNEFLAKILELDILAVPENDENIFQQSKNNANYASLLIPGNVLFSEDKGTMPYRAVQSNDSRLRQSSVEYPGIIQLAKDRESRANLAVQSNDSRLRQSSVEYPGIIQLAKDGESKASLAVQSNDSRLRLSSVEYPGIIQLAKDKEKKAGLAVQSNDSRLKNGSISWPGIVQFAKHNESISEMALQSDDPRLLEGDENIKGRVQFAQDKEISAKKAVQSNDSRLNKANTKTFGIVRFAENGKKIKGLAVQSSDIRLEDKRYPLPHEHDYAKKNHDYSTHIGNLQLKKNMETPKISGSNIQGIENFPFGVSNNQGTAACFIGGIISSNNKDSALYAVSENHPAIESISKNNAGAVFFSEKDYSIKILNEIENIKGSGKSVLAEGSVDFKGKVTIEGSSSVVVGWHKYASSVFLEGDLLTISESGELEKVSNYKQDVIGVYTKNSNFILNNKSEKNLIYFSISGIARVRVIGPIKAGSQIVFANSDSGLGKAASEKGQNQQVIAVSLENFNETREKPVWCILKI